MADDSRPSFGSLVVLLVGLIVALCFVVWFVATK